MTDHINIDYAYQLAAEHERHLREMAEAGIEDCEIETADEALRAGILDGSISDAGLHAYNETRTEWTEVYVSLRRAAAIPVRQSQAAGITMASLAEDNARSVLESGQTHGETA